jgi:hypothetical protein
MLAAREASSGTLGVLEFVLSGLAPVHLYVPVPSPQLSPSPHLLLPLLLS